MASFKPTLAVDATRDLDKIKYPKYASNKLDGIRCIFHPELGMVSRSLKPIQNKQLREKFNKVLEIAKKKNCIFDGELYGHKLTFQEITRAVMTQDFLDEKTNKKIPWPEAANLINQIEFHCFDYYSFDDDIFWERSIMVESNLSNMNDVVVLIQRKVESAKEVQDLFEEKLKEGYEGLILRDPDSPYKFGRSTLKEEYCLKVKPFETFDAEIIGIVQSTIVNPNAEKKTNKLGRSVTSKKKDDRILINKASAFVVKYGEYFVKPTLAMTDEEKEEVWLNQGNYIGRMIEYKGMQIGAKDVPRHPVFVRFREDK